MTIVHRAMPRSVKLLSQVIPIRLSEHILHEHEGPDGTVHQQPAYGVYKERPQTILMDRHLPFERKRETFLHENLHAMLSITNLDALIDSAQTDDEHVVSVLAPVLLAWLRDNPKAVAFLTEVQPSE